VGSIWHGRKKALDCFSFPTTKGFTIMQNMAYFHTGQIFSIAKKAYNKSISQTQQNKPSDDALVAIVFAVLTLEAVMSQVIHMAKSFANMSPKIGMFADFLNQLDDARTNLKYKYFLAHWLLCDKKLSRGAKLYQDFSLLIDIRNALVHLKPDKVSVESKIDNLLKKLNDRKLLSDGFIPCYNSGRRAIWVFYISNSNVAKWACNTAVSMIEGFWKETPDDKVKQFFETIAGVRSFKPLD
jgi:hypothetical protein